MGKMTKLNVSDLNISPPILYCPVETLSYFVYKVNNNNNNNNIAFISANLFILNIIFAKVISVTVKTIFLTN